MDGLGQEEQIPDILLRHLSVFQCAGVMDGLGEEE